MTKPKIYLDTNCFIELVIGEHGKFNHAKNELVEFYKLLLKASQDDKINTYTSMLTVSECLSINDGKNKYLDDETKGLFDRILLSGTSGIIPIQPTEFIIIRARNLNWDGIGIRKPMDLLHLASAIETGCQEFVTSDSEDLLKKSVVEKIYVDYKLKIITSIDECNSLPEIYKKDFRQESLDFPEEEKASS